MTIDKPKAIIFDMIETVFALAPVRGDLMRLGLASGDLETWFAFGLRDAFTLDATGSIAPFPDILKGALAQLLAIRGLPSPEMETRAVFETMKALPAHADARAALELLAKTGIPLYALSNGARASTANLLDKAGLGDFFARILSVETVGRFKPNRTVYEHGIASTGEAAADVMMIATHAWDTHGAKAAGMRAAFVARGQAYPAAMLPPDLTGAELTDVARLIADL
ncbi:haloacid dehalogenase type II [Fulvimarina sp. 2208YS6-2-32]|uniref:(S)-2-haloacid dehalogenase n=1 Tax=Fulvimarina uroteuthidis TaxID=3098149 RepID=A0ABU5I5A2_9HYPH|nr:haloacid dehalogenase type II [Fulvimarina sp. 2208YS6-2-32]MDY8110103.1 haloacid dehalogenase type II [Fulvimarina sp. 2208YS6-2-32]